MHAVDIAVRFASDITHRVITSPEAKNFVKTTEEKAKEVIVNATRRLFRKSNDKIIGHYDTI